MPSSSHNGARVTALAFHERHAWQAADAEHPDGEADDPEDREDANDDDRVPQPAGTSPVARYEDRLVGGRSRMLTLGFECRHGA